MNCLTVSVLILSFMMILDFLDIPYVNRYRLLWDFDFPTVSFRSPQQSLRAEYCCR